MFQTAANERLTIYAYFVRRPIAALGLRQFELVDQSAAKSVDDIICLLHTS
ncbi:hypothetical protein X742_17190 [Mesorhizobium sp. LNHC232B00]|nr:hypothetical protein X742_17190 [Mesorhizobium sp. LNHC232B00]